MSTVLKEEHLVQLVEYKKDLILQFMRLPKTIRTFGKQQIVSKGIKLYYLILDNLLVADAIGGRWNLWEHAQHASLKDEAIIIASFQRFQTDDPSRLFL